MDSNKLANNILDLLFDPTKYPIEDRMYFRPGEVLRNETYDKAVANAKALYGTQGHNSDFYPERRKNLIREASIMDRKTLTASLGVLSQQFKSEDDPISTDLRTMAHAVSKMSDEELNQRMIAEDIPVEKKAEEKKVEEKKAEAPVEEKKAEETPVEEKIAAKTFKCPECGTNVLQQTGYCVKCKKKVKKASDEGWTKKAADAVKKALIAEIIGDKESSSCTEKKEEKTPEEEKTAGAIKGPGQPDGTGPCKDTPECPKKEEKKAEKAPVEEEEAPVEEKVPAEKKAKEEVPAEKKAEDAEEAPPKSEVDTGILATVEGIEMEMGLMTADDLGDLNAEEQQRLDSLFRNSPINIVNRRVINGS